MAGRPGSPVVSYSMVTPLAVTLGMGEEVIGVPGSHLQPAYALRVSSKEAGAAAGLNQLRRAILARSSAIPVPFVVRAGGESLVMGDGDPAFEVSVLTPDGMAAVLSLRELAIAEAYMAGDIDFGGDLFAVMGLRDVLVDREVSVKAWAWLKSSEEHTSEPQSQSKLVC